MTCSISRENLRLPACLIIMDGFGLSAEGDGNAISLANTPVLDSLFASRPWTTLQASGNAVGLPAGQMGNSEVGHLNIGAGRIVHQELTRIDNACEDGSLASNSVIQNAFAGAKNNNGVVHMMGLLSDGGVHSSNSHLYSLLKAAAEFGVPRVFIHCFLDGRDVPPESGSGYVRKLQSKIDELALEYDGACEMRIASIEGRYYAMDRDNRWERIEKAYNAIVCAADAESIDPVEVVERSYANSVTDEFVVPVALNDRGMRDGDSVIFFNFRPDRARQITRAIVDEDFSGFDRACNPNVEFVCLTEYDPDIAAPVAFPKTFPENVLADVLADLGLKQLHIAETEKYAHVTFFLNGGKEEPKCAEERILVNSPKVATYDLQPEMSEPEVTNKLVDAINSDLADVYIVNFANCDMVGHTGVIPAAIAAVEAVDGGVGKVLDAIGRKGGIAFVTADHGNADVMIAKDGSPHTAHTTAPVPFILVDETGSNLDLQKKEGKLADIAPTLLSAIGLAVPSVMTGSNLLA
ncbi:2,3-bisphosphoglycerate-independent phosphoglycerate mutase [Adlercreutzia sp. ZJ304]|uniref:2,3-bisphosphoglycerate-independent phosphoglycerate mutase n=1 Tax=Adlercreutzia sp. ZJ304 TaxID=2709791 RepID=UPI0013EAFCAC|nr:2,3-bisphosphoglycerate-independent phosphoglycerate mutase [Adlercreutzia sp. ZJ304]